MLKAATLREWENAGRYIDWQGHRIFVRAHCPDALKDAPALVLVHGFPTASWDWLAIWPILAQSYRLIAMDMLGFGFSDKPAGFDYRLEQQTDLVDHVVALCGIKDAYAVVHDYGVSIGQELLHRQQVPGAQRPWRVRGMLFLNGGLFPETHRARFIQKLLASPIGGLIARLGNERTFRRSFAAVFGANTQPSEIELSHFWELVSFKQGHHRFHELIRYMADRRRRRDDWVAALRAADVPIRFVNGLDDPVSGAHILARARELLGPLDCVELPGIGHYPQCEAPQAVARSIVDWVEAQPA